MTQFKGFSTAVHETLTANGWYEGRNVDITHPVTALHSRGYGVHDAATQFLREFYGLAFTRASELPTVAGIRYQTLGIGVTPEIRTEFGYFERTHGINFRHSLFGRGPADAHERIAIELLPKTFECRACLAARIYVWSQVGRRVVFGAAARTTPSVAEFRRRMNAGLNYRCKKAAPETVFILETGEFVGLRLDNSATYSVLDNCDALFRYGILAQQVGKGIHQREVPEEWFTVLH